MKRSQLDSKLKLFLIAPLPPYACSMVSMHWGVTASVVVQARAVHVRSAFEFLLMVTFKFWGVARCGSYLMNYLLFGVQDSQSGRAAHTETEVIESASLRSFIKLLRPRSVAM